MDGAPIGEGTVVKVRKAPGDPKRMLVSIEVPDADAVRVAGLLELDAEEGAWGGGAADTLEDETIICRCERITAGEVRAEIRAGVRDMNTLKATIRTGMGACGGKTCTELILRLFREEGIDLSEVTLPTDRPFVAEVPLSVFAGIKFEEGGE
jgi:bacterioferritin-associated ferredoxin